MNNTQQVAFKFPCARGPQTEHPRFWSLMRVNGRVLSTILTVETFHSRPMWHASVGALPTRKLSATTKRIVTTMAKQMLDGVGKGASSVDQTDVAIHCFRSLSDEELAGVHKKGVDGKK
jgi:hypothetical protein